ncbi:MAG TPA: guanylate kinase [Acidiferrobacterales bacterium]|nr:guanylate kinase [Acidiferrobacterales bacterium]
MNPGQLFILSAPSGAGKSSLARALVESLPNLAVSISHTTRAPRPGEQHGVHYYFVDEPEFQALTAAGHFLEHAYVFGNFYGTSRATVERLLNSGKDVILDIDWQGARRTKELIPHAKGIFILPPSRAVLQERLFNRAQDAHAVVTRRLREAVVEMRHYTEFDYVIVNDDFAAALSDLKAIIQGNPQDIRPLKINIAELLRE